MVKQAAIVAAKRKHNLTEKDRYGANFTRYSLNVFNDAQLDQMNIIFGGRRTPINQIARAIHERKNTPGAGFRIDGNPEDQIVNRGATELSQIIERVLRERTGLRTGGQIAGRQVPAPEEWASLTGQKTVTAHSGPGESAELRRSEGFMLGEITGKPGRFRLILTGFGTRESPSDVTERDWETRHMISTSQDSGAILDAVNGIAGFGSKNRLLLSRYLMGDPQTPMLFLKYSRGGQADRIMQSLDEFRENNRELLASLGARGQQFLEAENLEISGNEIYVGRKAILEGLKERAKMISDGEAEPRKSLGYYQRLAIRTEIQDLHLDKGQIASVYAFFKNPLGDSPLEITRVPSGYARKNQGTGLGEYVAEVRGALAYLGVNPSVMDTGEAAPGARQGRILLALNLPKMGKPGKAIPVREEIPSSTLRAEFPVTFQEIANAFSDERRKRAVFGSLREHSGAAMQIMGYDEMKATYEKLQSLNIPGMEYSANLESREGNRWSFRITYAPQPVSVDTETKTRTYATDADAQLAFDQQKNPNLRLDGRKIIG